MKKRIILKGWVEKGLYLIDGILLTILLGVTFKSVLLGFIIKVLLFIIFSYIVNILMKYTDLGE